MAVPGSTQRVLDELALRGLTVTLIVSETRTRTAAEAAASLKTSVGQIVKSLVFLVDGAPVLALMSGTNRLDEAKLARVLAARHVVRANADQVRELTGFVIGGVPPVSLNPAARVLCDADLLQYPQVYAAAGTPHHNFAAEPRQLVTAARATVADLKVD